MSNQTINIIVLLLLTFIAGALLSIISMQGTEFLKVIWKALKTLPVEFFQKLPSGSYVSWVTSLIVAVLITFGLDINFLSAFPLFANVDNTMVHFLSAVLLWVGSNIAYQSKAVPKPVPPTPVRPFLPPERPSDIE